MVPETAPAEKRRQQVSESRSESGSIIAERSVKKKGLSQSNPRGNKKENPFQKE